MRPQQNAIKILFRLDGEDQPPAHAIWVLAILAARSLRLCT
jgi:hypothetical protein